jgi:hypothetical protein
MAVGGGTAKMPIVLAWWRILVQGGARQAISMARRICKMQRKTFWAGAALVMAVACFLAGSIQGEPAPFENHAARCTVNVPTAWGEYVGSGTSGMVFKDNSGTLRIVAHFPCNGLGGAPQVALEIRRN